MKQVSPLFKREFLGYFRSPVAYVFLVVFQLATIVFALFIGRFFDANSASLDSYFNFMPWLFLFLVPSAGMRLWSEEKRTGTIELLFTLPVTTIEAAIGKFLAAWAFIAIAIALSFPLVITVAYLGHPDWGVMFAGYLGTILMAGAFLGVGGFVSALTKNQVISFVISVLACAVIDLLGASAFTDFLNHYLSVPLVDTISNFSFLTHFQPFTKGIVDPKDVLFFLSLTGFTLFLNVVALER